MHNHAETIENRLTCSNPLYQFTVDIFVLGLKRIYRIFVFEFDLEFVRKYIEIRNTKIPVVKNSFQFLQIANNK